MKVLVFSLLLQSDLFSDFSILIDFRKPSSFLRLSHSHRFSKNRLLFSILLSNSSRKKGPLGLRTSPVNPKDSQWQCLSQFCASCRPRSSGSSPQFLCVRTFSTDRTGMKRLNAYVDFCGESCNKITDEAGKGILVLRRPSWRPNENDESGSI